MDIEQKLKQLELQLQKSNEKIAKYENNSKYIKELYKYGIGDLTFMKTVTKETGHTSDHQKIFKEENKEFNILTNINDYIDKNKLGTTPSSFLNECENNDYNIRFYDESTVQELVNLYIKDIIKGSRLNLKSTGGSVKAVAEESNKNIINTKKDYIPDFWVTLNNDYRPILVIEVKSPIGQDSSSKTKINNTKISGQLYDYMLKLKTFYNQKYVFGIVTTLDEWKICWLPNGDDCAISEILLENNLEENEYVQINDREIHSTRVYKHNERDLTKIILSVIVKCYESPKNLVSLISHKRIYIELREKAWRWVEYTENKINKLKQIINLELPDIDEISNTYMVIRYFKGGHYSKIRLVLTEYGNIVILKDFIDNDNNLEVAEQEKECWQKINNIQNVRLITVVDKIALMMPLVFHVHVDRINKRIHIPLDLKIWSVEDKAISDRLPKYLENINNQLSTFNIDIRNIAETSIEKCALQGYIHDDLEFRHIAVYPVIHEGEVVRLTPVFIDFGIMRKVHNIDEARIEMTNRLDKLFEDYKHYKFN